MSPLTCHVSCIMSHTCYEGVRAVYLHGAVAGQRQGQPQLTQLRPPLAEAEPLDGGEGPVAGVRPAHDDHVQAPPGVGHQHTRTPGPRCLQTQGSGPVGGGAIPGVTILPGN